MSENESNEKSGMKVQDKRRVDSEGRLKSDSGHSGGKNGSASSPKNPEPSAQDAAAQNPSAQKTPSEQQPAPEESAAGRAAREQFGGADEISFSTFVMSLATQALMQLGEVPPPPGVEVSVNREAARQTIEILGMLEKKTKNNLDSDEARLMSEVLHNLRMSFVRKK